MATVQDIIDHIPVGKENAINAAAFEAMVGNVPRGTNNDQTRQEIRSAIFREELPIGSTSHDGYWLINSEEEFREIINGIDTYIETYRAKRDAISRGWERRVQSGFTWPR